jgi:5-methylcytosine-specific restriction endonuclease McrA
MLRTCRKCGTEYPLNKDNFGHQPNGNYRYTCRKCVRAAVSWHYYQNPEQTKERTELRRHTTFTATEKRRYELRLAKRDGWGCFYCKKFPDDYHIDHKQPPNRGGSHSMENWVLACMQCNQEKHNKTVDEYRAWLRERGEEVNF